MASNKEERNNKEIRNHHISPSPSLSRISLPVATSSIYGSKADCLTAGGALCRRTMMRAKSMVGAHVFGDGAMHERHYLP